jgi:hypothetical protein
MLFIMVMDVLNSLVTKASELGLLQPLMRRGNGQRVSLYADDVVLFPQPKENELNLVKEILRIFCEASSLITNIGKCSMTPIQCNENHIETSRSILPCNVISFPCKYLGLPLSVRKLSKHDFLELIDKLADRLPGWKASMVNMAGRTTLVKAVLTAIPIYHLIALQCPKWVIKAIDKIRRGFLWKDRKDVKGGHCMVSWAKVCRPFDLGALGLHNLEVLGWVLNMRWLWMKKTQPNPMWADLKIRVHPNAAAMFACSVVSLAGDGSQTSFWTDRWLHGQALFDLAPVLVSRVLNRFLQSRTVNNALTEYGWVNDISGSISAQFLSEYFMVWDLIQGFQLHPGVSDQHRLTPSASGEYSSKSAHHRFFEGMVTFEPAARICKSWAPPRCKFFIWLASLNRCWTADRLARRGLDHPTKCLLCDQEKETMQHILLQCVFAREVWFHTLSLTA